MASVLPTVSYVSKRESLSLRMLAIRTVKPAIKAILYLPQSFRDLLRHAFAPIPQILSRETMRDLPAQFLQWCTEHAQSILSWLQVFRAGGWKDFQFYAKVYANCVTAFFRACWKLWRVVNWMFVPYQMATVFLRHAMSLLALFYTYQIWKFFFAETMASSVDSMYRRFAGNAVYRDQAAQLRRQRESALTYKEWAAASQGLDQLEGLWRWKQDPRSTHYDYQRILNELEYLRALVDATLEDGDNVHKLMFYMRSHLMRNLAGIGNRKLFSVLRDGTKVLVEEYIGEVVRALQLVCTVEAETVSVSDRLSFFNETRHAFGRSALMFSGGATLGMYHVGVIKALLDNNLMPRVISGSSVGSLIASIIGTHTDEELNEMINNQAIDLNFFPPRKGAQYRKLRRLLTEGVLLDINILKNAVRANVPDLTFQEAYDRTGRIINITISPPQGSKDGARLLNYLTSPNVLVWSAALASCAIPFVYAPVEILCRNAQGDVEPFFRNGVKWVDGSVLHDLPMNRLAELFNVNHFIVSQTNPHVVPFLMDTEVPRAMEAGYLNMQGIVNQSLTFLPNIIKYLNRELKYFILNLRTIGLLPKALDPMSYIIDQKYVGDITITPPLKFSELLTLLQNPTPEKLAVCTAISERETWKKMSIIRNHCEIEFTLDECVRRMRGCLIIEATEGVAKRKERMSRVRSWTAEQFSSWKEGSRDKSHSQSHSQSYSNSPRVHPSSSLSPVIVPRGSSRRGSIVRDGQKTLLPEAASTLSPSGSTHSAASPNAAYLVLEPSHPRSEVPLLSPEGENASLGLPLSRVDPDVPYRETTPRRDLCFRDESAPDGATHSPEAPSLLNMLARGGARKPNSHAQAQPRRLAK